MFQYQKDRKFVFLSFFEDSWSFYQQNLCFIFELSSICSGALLSVVAAKGKSDSYRYYVMMLTSWYMLKSAVFRGSPVSPRYLGVACLRGKTVFARFQTSLRPTLLLCQTEILIRPRNQRWRCRTSKLTLCFLTGSCTRFWTTLKKHVHYKVRIDKVLSPLNSPIPATC